MQENKCECRCMHSHLFSSRHSHACKRTSAGGSYNIHVHRRRARKQHHQAKDAHCSFFPGVERSWRARGVGVPWVQDSHLEPEALQSASQQLPRTIERDSFVQCIRRPSSHVGLGGSEDLSQSASSGQSSVRTLRTGHFRNMTLRGPVQVRHSCQSLSTFQSLGPSIRNLTRTLAGPAQANPKWSELGPDFAKSGHFHNFATQPRATPTSERPMKRRIWPFSQFDGPAEVILRRPGYDPQG